MAGSNAASSYRRSENFDYCVAVVEAEVVAVEEWWSFHAA
jgi:hypothetical protein